jgi:hypothetical protein
VAGIEEQRDVGALRLLAEVEQPLGHLVAREIGAFDHFEADIAERAGHRLCVNGRIRERSDILVGAVADHESDTLLGICGAGRKGHADYRQNEGWVAHQENPPAESKRALAKGLPQTTRKIRASCHKKATRADQKPRNP